MAKSKVIIELDCTPLQAKRIEEIVVTLINQGALNVLFGNSVLHFLGGELKAVDLNIKQWHVDKPQAGKFIMKINE